MRANPKTRKLVQQSEQKIKSQTINSQKPQAKQQSTRDFDTHWKTSLEDYITALAWSTDGSALAAGSASGEVLLWTGTRTVWLRAAGSEQAIGTLGFSANGQYLAAAGQQGSVFIWDLATEAVSEPPAVVLENSACWIDRLVWHPSQLYLAVGVGSQVKVWDISQKTMLSEKSFEASSALDIAWHPNGQLLAVSGHTGVKVWAAEDWDAPPELIEVPGASLSIAWSEDGQYLASGNLDRTLTVVDWGKPPPWLMQGFPGKVRQVDWACPSGNDAPLVAAACVEGITVWRRRGKKWESKVLQKHEGTVEAIAFHPTTSLLASAAQDGRLCLWKKAASLQQTLRGVKEGFSAIAWHPQGYYLAAGGSQGEIILWAPSSRGTGFQKR